MSTHKSTYPDRPTDRIFVVDDDPEILVLVSRWLTQANFEVKTFLSGEEAYAAFLKAPPSLIITDLIMQGMSGLDLLQKIHLRDPLQPVILFSGQATIPDAIKATHMGSAAFLVKPVPMQELLDNVKRHLRSHHSEETEKIFSSQMIYRSEIMAKVVELAQIVAGTNVTILISGGTGTGKEVIARAIHQASPRREHPFIAINCGAIPEHLLESELFGHEKGSFSGAIVKHEGLFQAANGGTLFLDEVGDLPLSLQVKLLRVLQDLQVRPVGSTKFHPVDIRIISATHQSLEEKIARGEFREDLYYRLKVVPIVMPSLSQRREDIPLLISYFLKVYAEKNKKIVMRFAPDALQHLINAPWPGNIRQLINVIDLCATLCKNEVIPLGIAQMALQDRPEQMLTFEQAKHEFERNYLISIMRITDGNITNAAAISHLTRTYIYKLLEEHAINLDDFRESRHGK